MVKYVIPFFPTLAEKSVFKNTKLDALTLRGGVGNDRIFGEEGNDRLFGDRDRDK